jgi:hypothetical protein
MAVNYLSHLDLNKNELQHAVIQPLGSDPSSPSEGQIYYNSTNGNKKMYYWDGTSWKSFSGDIESVDSNTVNQLTVTNSTGPNPVFNIVTGSVVSGGTALATTGDIYNHVATAIGDIAFTVDGTTNEIEVTNGIDAGDGSTITIGLPSDVTIGNDLIVTGDLTVNGTTTTVNSTTVTIDDPIFTLGGDTAPSSDDNKDRGIEFQYHDGSAAQLGFFGFDDSTGKFTFLTAASNTSEVFTGTKGNLDINNIDLSGSIKSIDGVAPTNGQILIGNTANSDMQLATITAGEAISITNAAGSITLAVEDATETNKGVIELASAAEALAGTDTIRAVTPAGLAARSWSGSIGDGSTTAITITHSLNTKDIIVQLYDTTTNETVYADVARGGVNTATITFSTAPAANAIRVLVTKID